MTILITNPLHLYRAILRETTYIFDQSVQQWARAHVRSSFRQHSARIHDGKSWKPISYNPDRIPSQNERYLLKRGRGFLVLLQRANKGYPRSLKNLLQLAYGRKGRQKRMLAAPFIRSGLRPVVDSVGQAGGIVVSEGVATKNTHHADKWMISDKLMSLICNQQRVEPLFGDKRSIRLKPTIEEKNRWGKPMPLCRIKNTTKAWYAKSAALLMPPVPEHEWDAIRAIALGKQEFRIAPRRAVARMSAKDQQLQKEADAAQHIVSGAEKGISNSVSKIIKHPHKLTPRFLSRFYAKYVFNHTPMALPHPTGGGLVVKWDDARRDIHPVVKPKDASQINALFG